MSVTDIPFAVLRFQYRLARTPLQLIESRFMTRVDPEAPGRLLYERAIGAVDAAAGSFLRDSELEERGITRIENASARGEAARLDEVAEQQKQQAADELQRKRDKAATAPEKAGQRVRDAQQKADKRTQDVAQSVASRTAQAKREVDAAAEQKVEAAEKAKAGAQNRSRAAEKLVTSAAEKELDDAAAKRSAATEARAHADRLEDFSDAEKDRRQADKSDL